MERNWRCCTVERKTFDIRFEGEDGGFWISITKRSQSVTFSMGFEKEEIDWLEHLKKAFELKRGMGLITSTEEKPGHISWR